MDRLDAFLDKRPRQGRPRRHVWTGAELGAAAGLVAGLNRLGLLRERFLRGAFDGVDVPEKKLAREGTGRQFLERRPRSESS